jgi:hypothetical protein
MSGSSFGILANMRRFLKSNRSSTDNGFLPVSPSSFGASSPSVVVVVVAVEPEDSDLRTLL